jgi:hypothetical protein
MRSPATTAPGINALIEVSTEQVAPTLVAGVTAHGIV